VTFTAARALPSSAVISKHTQNTKHKRASQLLVTWSNHLYYVRY